MDIIKLSDKDNEKSFALLSSGIVITEHKYGTRTIFDVSVLNGTNVEKYCDTRFYNLNDILYAFKDVLYKNKFLLVAA